MIGCWDGSQDFPSRGIPPSPLGNRLAHDIDVSLRCRRCQTATLVLIGELVERFGEDYLVAEIGEVARRLRCGNLGADVSAAVRAMR